MRIYFAMTIIGNRSNIRYAHETVRMLEEKGHEIITKQFLNDNAYESDGRITPQEIFERDIRWMKEADAIVIDATGSSFGIGFEAGFTVGALDKPLFILYNENHADKISRLARGLTHKRATVFAYKDLSELEIFINNHF